MTVRTSREWEDIYTRSALLSTYARAILDFLGVNPDDDAVESLENALDAYGDIRADTARNEF